MVKSLAKVLLLNIHPEDVKVNESALEEMVKMTEKSLFLWQHVLIELNGIRVYLFDLISILTCNGHLEHFLGDEIYSTYFKPILFHRN